MFFVFSKILAFLLAPMLHSLFCLLASGLFLLIRAKFLALLCLILAGALPLLYSWTFFGATGQTIPKKASVVFWIFRPVKPYRMV